MAVLLILKGTVVLGQPTVGVKVGLKAGYNLANFIEPQTGSPDHFLPGYTIGLALEKGVFQPLRLSVAIDLLYSKQGNQTPVQGATVYPIFDKIIYRHDYVSLPIKIKYKLKQLPFSIGAGIQIGYLIHDVREFHVPPGYPAVNGSGPYSDPFLKKFDLGWLASISYPVGDHIQIEAKYYRSINDLNKGLSGPDPLTGQTVLQSRLYNQLITGSLSYYFN
ncbi:porin family protein [Spirosoma koreense]